MIVSILKLFGINIVVHFVLMSLYIYCTEEIPSVLLPWILPFSLLFWAPITTITLLVGSYLTKNKRWKKSIILIILSVILFQTCSFLVSNAINYLDKNGFFPHCFYYDVGDGCLRMEDWVSTTIQYVMASILLLISMVVINKVITIVSRNNQKQINT